ncbi:hypothetical protein QJS10_CPA08g01136 [Acorus calamus]|uniref:Aminotransferase-like plant mobile domain-containing protein n=1 Tax=Acorus calamus TaxID=4465 RepID=A0AAV9EBA6_ACOCL|nr:hypothetical protein QJS10_CPA08g01136 [Acorus calamus]
MMLIKTNEHRAMLHKWKLTDAQEAYLKRTKLDMLARIPDTVIDRPFITALLSFFDKERNLFVIGDRKFFPSLEDMTYIYGLPADGVPVVCDVDHGDAERLCQKYFGDTKDLLLQGSFHLVELRKRFENLEEFAPENTVEMHTRAYLLYLLGCTIFSTSGLKVSYRYLYLLEDFDKAGTYAWGAAALAYLFRELAEFTSDIQVNKKRFKKPKTNIGGSLLFLQLWAYEHFPIAIPNSVVFTGNVEIPLCLAWHEKCGKALKDVHHKQRLDEWVKKISEMREDEIIYEPYKNRVIVVPDHLCSSIALGRAQTALICFEIVEHHLPNECYKQFGYQYSDPLARGYANKCRSTTQGVRKKSWMDKFKVEIEDWERRWSSLIHLNNGAFPDASGLCHAMTTQPEGEDSHASLQLDTSLTLQDRQLPDPSTSNYCDQVNEKKRSSSINIGNDANDRTRSRKRVNKAMKFNAIRASESSMETSTSTAAVENGVPELNLQKQLVLTTEHESSICVQSGGGLSWAIPAKTIATCSETLRGSDSWTISLIKKWTVLSANTVLNDFKSELSKRSIEDWPSFRPASDALLAFLKHLGVSDEDLSLRLDELFSRVEALKLAEIELGRGEENDEQIKIGEEAVTMGEANIDNIDEELLKRNIEVDGILSQVIQARDAILQFQLKG